jgi:hypothetical protein
VFQKGAAMRISEKKVFADPLGWVIRWCSAITIPYFILGFICYRFSNKDSWCIAGTGALCFLSYAYLLALPLSYRSIQLLFLPLPEGANLSPKKNPVLALFGLTIGIAVITHGLVLLASWSMLASIIFALFATLLLIAGVNIIRSLATFRFKVSLGHDRVRTITLGMKREDVKVIVGGPPGAYGVGAIPLWDKLNKTVSDLDDWSRWDWITSDGHLSVRFDEQGQVVETLFQDASSILNS